MTRGNIVKTVRKPSYKTVDQYIEYLKVQSPNPELGYELMDPDIRCPCCSQEAPHVAAAMLKVEDETPTFQKFGAEGIGTSGTQGEVVWLCADCYTNGVRPKHIYFGDIKWNKMGRKVKQRAQRATGSPWR